VVIGSDPRVYGDTCGGTSTIGCWAGSRWFQSFQSVPSLISGVVGESDLWEGVMVAERKRRGGGDVRR
jgi:hypothetical protein